MNGDPIYVKVATMGDVDSGKSTVAGALVTHWSQGLHNFNHFHEVCDTLSFEMQNNVTWQVGHRYCNADNIRFHFFDDPGHLQRFGITLSGIMGSDIVLYFMNMDSINIPLLKLHMAVLNFLNNDRVLFVCNRWSEATSESGRLGKVKELVESTGLTFRPIPVSQFPIHPIEGSDFRKDISKLADTILTEVKLPQASGFKMAVDSNCLIWDSVPISALQVIWSDRIEVSEDMDDLVTTAIQTRLTEGFVTLGKVGLTSIAESKGPSPRWGALVRPLDFKIIGLLRVNRD